MLTESGDDSDGLVQEFAQCLGFLLERFHISCLGLPSRVRSISKAYQDLVVERVDRGIAPWKICLSSLR